MREIKFRAWHKKMLMMISCDVIDFSGNTIRKGERTIIEDKQNGGCFLLENCVLMQYTGFNDINGKEIYEGDILKKELYEEIVSFEEGCFWMGEVAFIDMVIEGVCEIIGNIYKNPELIKN